MSLRHLELLLKPRRVALIGAAAAAGTVAAVVLANLQRAGLKGRLMLVNPHHHELAGLPVYPDVASLPEAPDLAVIVSPAPSLPGLITELGRAGTKAAVVLTAAGGEPGGAALRQAALAAARPHRLRLLGPGSFGLMAPGIGLDASLSPTAALAGDLAFISQSGAMIAAVLDWAAPRRLGFSHVVSLGDMADVDFGDLIDYLAADPETRAILLYLEGITQARKFMSAARAAARTLPVLAVKVGRFGDNAGADAVYDAAFRRAGMLRVETLTELFDAVETLALTRPQHGDRLAILTNGAGPGRLAADALLGAGGTLAPLSAATVARLAAVLPASWGRGNPVDIGGDAPAERYAEALKLLLEETLADAILVLNAPSALAGSAAAAQAVIDTLAAFPPAAFAGRNLLTAWLGEGVAAPARARFAAARIASYETPESAVRGFLHRVHYRRNQELLMETPAAPPDGFAPDQAAVSAIIGRTLAGGGGRLAAGEAAAVLGAYGIASGLPARPGALALCVGLTDDPVFGPVLQVGEAGGTGPPRAALALELAPLNAALARAQLRRSRLWPRLEGAAGRPGATIDAIALVLIRVAQLAADHPQIRELAIEPLFADAAGAGAGGARIEVAPAAGAARLAISPYPKDCESAETLSDGTRLRLAPVRPEDEPSLQDLAGHMNPDDLRLRFFTPMRALPHGLAARLSQLDYDREMALIARPEHGADALGVVRFCADPDNRRAEFAVALRSDWKGRGLGRLMMTRILEIAGRRGIAEIIGDVLHENEPMLKLARALGFSLAAHPEDPALVRVSKALAPGADAER